LAALVFEFAPLVLEIAHALDEGVQPGARLARLGLPVLGLRLQGGKFLGDAGGARACGLDLAALSLPLAGQLGLAAMGLVELALDLVARPLDLRRLHAQGIQPAAGILDQGMPLLDLRLQGADLALAGQHAEPIALGTPDPRPAVPQPFAGRGDHRLAGRKRAGTLLRLRQIGRGEDMREQGHGRRRAAHVGGKRVRRGGRGGVRRRKQADVGLVQSGQGGKQAGQIIDQHTVEQAGQHGLDRPFPLGIDGERRAEPPRMRQTMRGEPGAGRPFVLAQGRVLQGLERSQPAARGFQLPARLVKTRLTLPRRLLHAGKLVLVCLEPLGQELDPCALGVVFLEQLSGGLIQRGEIDGLLLGGQRLATAGKIQQLAVQIIQPRALDLGGAAGLAGGAGMGFPALLPVGEPRLGFALGLRGVVLALREGFQPRLALGQFAAQALQPRLVVRDVREEPGPLALGLGLGAFQPLRGLAMVTRLLLDPGEFGADLVDLGLRGVELIARLHVAFAHRLEFRLHLPLGGHAFFDAKLGRRQALRRRFVLTLQDAVFQRAQFRLLAQLFFLERFPALGRARLAVQVFQLLVDLVAHVLDAFEILARGLDPAFRLLAPLLVFGDAGGFFQMRAQLLRVGFDDLADHALLDDRIAARPEARAEKEVGDVATAAARAIQEIHRLAVAADLTLDRDFGVFGVFALDRAVGIVEDEFHRRLPHRLARAGT
jgi:hypothetical protein